MKFKKRDMFDDKAAIKIGKQTEAELIIRCVITVTKNGYNVSVRGIDTDSGKALFTENRETKNKQDLNQIVEQLGTTASKDDAEKAVFEKSRLEQERLAKEAEEKARLEEETSRQTSVDRRQMEEKTEENTQSAKENIFTKNEERFIDTFYNKMWKFSIDDRRLSLLRYRQFIGVGIGLAASGGTILLAGVISTIVLSVYSEDVEIINLVTENDKGESGNYNKIETGKRYYRSTAPIVGGILMPTGAIISVLSVIPFWFSYMIKTIYSKVTGDKLSFFDRMGFDIGFNNNAKCEMQNTEYIIRFSLTILI
jgi:hypothetical protein